MIDSTISEPNETDNTFSSDSIESPSIRLCDLCQKEPCKYRCPRCSFRTCSMACSKEHKVKYTCSGEREKSFDVIKRLADFSPSVAAEDEKFLHSVTTSMENSRTGSFVGETRLLPDVPLSGQNGNTHAVSSEVTAKRIAEDNKEENGSNGFENYSSPSLDEFHDDDHQTSSSQMNDVKKGTAKQPEWKAISTRRYLLNNAHRRRIWLSITPEKGNSSRHEQYSDTIFWTIKMIFRLEKCEEEGAEKRIIEYSYTVNNIPESISVATLLRQFIKPKKIGPVVSQSELDAEKMAPFQEAGMDKLMVYMPVPIDGKQRFYVIEPSKTILDNTRNRFINEYPTLIVTLDNQFNDYVMLSEQEAQELRELQRQKNRDENQNSWQNSFRGRGRFDDGRFMSRGRGGGRRGGFKRSYNSPDGRNGTGPGKRWKFGRSSRGGSYQNRGFHHREIDIRRDGSEFSLFESENCDQRPAVAIPSQAADPVVDAWSRAVEIKAKMEADPVVGTASDNKSSS